MLNKFVVVFDKSANTLLDQTAYPEHMGKFFLSDILIWRDNVRCTKCASW